MKLSDADGCNRTGFIKGFSHKCICELSISEDIFSLIQRHLQLSQPVKRLWISDLTPETIRKGFAELKEGSEYENLTKAARARSEADWLIGMNGSRAFTTKHNVLLSVGRVQTPVLALIYDRQKQIEAFDSLKFFELEGYFTQNDYTYKAMWQGDRMTDQAKVEALAAKVKGKQGRIATYDVKDTKEYPNKLYDLTLLQREANAKYSFSAKKTLDTAQALYEKHKVISYPRTNSNYVTEQNIPEMHKTLSVLQSTSYGDLVAGADRSIVHKGNKSICNPTKVEDHHAILPTHRKAANLSPDEQKLYDLIVRRFLSQFYPPAEYKVHTVMTEVEGETFKTTVKELLSLGWKVVTADQKKDPVKKSKGKDKDDDDEEETEVNEPFMIQPKDDVTCTDAIVKEKDTQPPKHYTEGTLLKAMESAGKQIENEELRDAMKDSGLGTPATRAATIERLKSVGYVDMQGKRIQITQKGRTVIELIRGAGIELLTSPEMTGQWERRLNEISRGTASDEQFMGNVKKFATMIVDKVRVQSRASKTMFESEDSAQKPAAKKRTTAQSTGTTKPATKSRQASTSSSAKSAESMKPAEQKNSAPTIISKCPRPGCGGMIFMGRKGYGCSHYKEGCKFVIWKENFGRVLTDAQVKALIEKGKTSKVKLSLEDGTPSDARLVIKSLETGELTIEP